MSESAISQAIDEAVTGRPGPFNAVAQATVPAPAPEVQQALRSFLRLRGLSPTGSTVWQQESGWWPDLYRFTAITAVALSVNEAAGGTTVRLTARLDRVWRGHLGAALLAPLLLAVTLFGVGPSISMGSVLGAFAWVGAAAWTYRLRLEAVRRRLAGALVDVARPAYRLQPW
ncbi:MAG: hypothetical protein GY778_20830 [bacterium]|nr:hypothetical protein [bacterium]